MPCLNMCTLWFLDLPLSLEEMVQKIYKLKKSKRNSCSEASEIQWWWWRKTKWFPLFRSFSLTDDHEIWVLLDPTFLRGIQTLKLGRSDDDDDAKQNGFFCYGSSWDGTKRTGSNTRWMLSCEPQVPHNTMAIFGFVCSFKDSFGFAVELRYITHHLEINQ